MSLYVSLLFDDSLLRTAVHGRTDVSVTGKYLSGTCSAPTTQN